MPIICDIRTAEDMTWRVDVVYFAINDARRLGSTCDHCRLILWLSLKSNDQVRIQVLFEKIENPILFKNKNKFKFFFQKKRLNSQ